MTACRTLRSLAAIALAALAVWIFGRSADPATSAVGAAYVLACQRALEERLPEGMEPALTNTEVHANDTGHDVHADLAAGSWGRARVRCRVLVDAAGPRVVGVTLLHW